MAESSLLFSTILFLRGEDVLHDAHHALPQRCPSGEDSVCVDGGIREHIRVPISGDGRTHDFLHSGFEYVALKRPERILPLLRRVRSEGLSGAEGPRAAVASGVGGVMSQLLPGGASRPPPPADTKLARAVEGVSTLSLRGVRLVAAFRCSGLVMRRAGPALSAPLEDVPAWDGSGAARKLAHAGDVRLPAHTPHIDQDADGEPLRTMGLSGLFRWIPGLRLLNLWLPLSQSSPVRPLALMDVRTLDRAAELVRYRAAFKVNVSAPTDVLLLRHAPSQSWHFDATLGEGDAIVFDAMRTPHASFEVQGEAELAELRANLRGWLDDADGSRWGDEREAGCAPVAPDADRRQPPPLGPLLPGLVDESRALLAEACAGGADRAALAERVRDVLRRSERLSLEMRCAALVVPDFSVARLLLAAFGVAALLRVGAGFRSRAKANLRSRAVNGGRGRGGAHED